MAMAMAMDTFFLSFYKFALSFDHLSIRSFDPSFVRAFFSSLICPFFLFPPSFVCSFYFSIICLFVLFLLNLFVCPFHP